jgi:hypothetical protein
MNTSRIICIPFLTLYNNLIRNDNMLTYNFLMVLREWNVGFDIKGETKTKGL